MLRIVATPMDEAPASALVREMTVEVGALYGQDPDVPVTFDPTLFSPPDGTFLVAYRDDEPVGCAGFRRIDAELAQVQRVFVRPAARGSGAAQTLMAEVERRALERGYRRLRLETGTRQPAAIRLYESLGYTPIACFPPYEDDPFSRCYAKRIG